MPYAERTKIPPNRTRQQIEDLMRRRGADQFYSGSNLDSAILVFRLQGRHFRFVLPLGQKMPEQKIRARWRALFLAIKARLESIDAGITTLEEAFLPETVLPDRHTVAEVMAPQIEAAYQSGTMPPLLEHHR